MLKSVSIAIVVLAVLAVPGAAAAGSFVWRVDGGDNSVYLAGSLHLLPPRAYPLPPAFNKAFARSEIIAFETNIDKLQTTAVQTRLFRAARYDHGGLPEHLGDRLYARLSEVLADMGLSMSAVRPFRPWFVATMIELSAFRAAGFKKKLGLDIHFYQKAKQAGKAILALETVEQHLKLLTQMSPEAARAYLRTTVKRVEKLQKAPSRIYRYWRSGNAQGLAEYVQGRVEAAAALFQRLLFARNRRWLEHVEQLLAGSKDAMVIVGALHLVGERGLVQQLEERGYRVTRFTPGTEASGTSAAAG